MSHQDVLCGFFVVLRDLRVSNRSLMLGLTFHESAERPGDRLTTLDSRIADHGSRITTYDQLEHRESIGVTTSAEKLHARASQTTCKEMTRKPVPS